MTKIYEIQKKEIPPIISFYSIGRLLSLVTKPLLLFLLIKFSTDESATLFAQILTISISLSLLFGVEIHMDFYKARFSNSPKLKNIIIEEIAYLRDLISLNLITSLLSFIIFFLISGNLILCVLFSLYMFVEIIYAEQSRYLIFLTRFNEWTIMTLSKSVIQLVFTISSIYYIDSFDSESFMIGTIIFSILFFTIFQDFSARRRAYFSKTSKVSFFSIKRLFNIYSNKFYFLIASIASKHLLLIDRYVVMFIKPSFFAIYTLFCNVVSSIPTLMDIYFLTKNRYRYVSIKITFIEFIKDKLYRLSLAIGFITSIVIIFLTAYFVDYQDMQLVELFSYGFLLILVYLFYSASMPLYELFFWHEEAKKRFYLEASILFCIFCSGIFTFFFTEESLFTFLALSGLSFLGRLYLLNKIIY